MKYATILLTVTATLSTALAQLTNGKKPFLKGNDHDCAQQFPEEEKCHGTKRWCEIPYLRKQDGYKTFKECFDDHEPNPDNSILHYPDGATNAEKEAMALKLCHTRPVFENKYEVSEGKCKEKLLHCLEKEGGVNAELKVLAECLDNEFS